MDNGTIVKITLDLYLIVNSYISIYIFVSQENIDIPGMSIKTVGITQNAFVSRTICSPEIIKESVKLSM